MVLHCNPPGISSGVQSYLVAWYVAVSDRVAECCEQVMEVDASVVEIQLNVKRLWQPLAREASLRSTRSCPKDAHG